MGKGEHHHHHHGCQEAGDAWPYMMESPQLRWAFIRKVYAIVAMQLLATVVAAATVYSVPAIRGFFAARTPASLAAFVAIIVAPVVVLLPMVFLRKRHPVNLLLLALFTVCISLALGLSCLSTKGVVVIEAASLTLVVVVGLTLRTFWAARRGHDFGFLGPFLAAACLVLVLYGLAQVLLPMGSVATTVYGCVAALVFSGFVIYDTDNLVKRHAYDEYVMAAISLYLDTVNIFIAIVTCFSASDS